MAALRASAETTKQRELSSRGNTRDSLLLIESFEFESETSGKQHQCKRYRGDEGM